MISVVMNTSAGSADEKISALSGIYVSCLSLSLIGSGSVLVVSILKRSHLNVQAKPLLLLALADFLASVVLMGTVILNFLSYDTLPVKDSEKLCNYGLPLSLTFYFISFLLVIIYACESAHVFQGWRERTEVEGFENQLLRRRRMFCLFYIIVWLIPIVGYIVYVNTVTVMQATLTPTNKLISSAPKTARFCNSCILFLHITNDTCPTVDSGHAEFIRVFTLTSVLIVLMSCTVVYCQLQSCYMNYENTSVLRMSQNHPGGIWSSARYMILVIIFCWAPALLLICLSFASPNIRPSLFPLYVLQAISVSLQGFLNSIVYAWRRRNFRDAVLGERLPLMAYSNKAFFEQSLSEPMGN